MSLNAPRPRDAIIARLRQLTATRETKRDDLMTTLATLDALDQRIDAAVAELADCIRPVPAPRRAGDDAHLARGGGQGVRAEN